MAELERWPHAAAILVGGESSRMGQRKDLLRLPDGRMMLEVVADALRPLTKRIIVVGQTTALPDDTHVSDLRPGLGPLGGIESVLTLGSDEEYLVCPCDLPCITPDVILPLLRPSDAPMTVLHIDGEHAPRPLPARVSKSALEPLRALLAEGRRSVKGLIPAVGADVAQVSSALAPLLHNVNTPADLDMLTSAPRARRPT